MNEVITAIIAVAGSIAASAIAWRRFKSKLGQIRKLVDALDDALYDDRISEDEYAELWETFKGVISKEP